MNRKIAVLLTVLVALGGAAGAVAAADWDTETTTTSTQSDVSGASNTETAYWGNSSEAVYLETDNASTSNLTLELSPAQSGVDYVAYSNSSPETVDDANGHYAFNVSYDELDIPRDASGGEYNATIVDDNGSVVVDTQVTFETAASANQDSIVAVTDDGGSDGAALTNLVADTLTIESQESSGFWSMFSLSSSENDSESDVDFATFSAYTQINSTDSDAEFRLVNDSTATAYSNAAEDVEDGAWVKGQTVWINGEPYKVYKNQVPDSVESTETTVVYEASSDTLRVNFGDDFDSRTVSVRSAGGQSYGFGEAWSNFGLWDAFGTLW